MDWDQIESKWAVMTRRIRSDWSADKSNTKASPARRTFKSDAKHGIYADGQTNPARDARQTISIE